MHSYYLFKFYSVTTQETACLFLNESIRMASWPFITLHSSPPPVLTWELSPTWFFFLVCYGKCPRHQLHFKDPVSSHISLCTKRARFKEVKDDLGQPLHEIIMEITILYISSNKLKEQVHERAVWVGPTCALCIGQHRECTDKYQKRYQESVWISQGSQKPLSWVSTCDIWAKKYLIQVKWKNKKETLCFFFRGIKLNKFPEI